MRSLPILAFLAACAGSTETDTDTDTDAAGPACTSELAIVTDIDETLTTSDGEWLAQLIDGSHDPAMRPEADALMRAYDELGYTVFYVTARGEDSSLSDGRDARTATADWLVAHGFPYQPDNLFLAEGIGALGDDAVTYKSEVLAELQGDGWTFDWAYGNAESDILAFQASAIPDDRIFLVGRLAGTMPVEPIPDEEAYGAHLESHLPTVPSACAR